MLSSANLSSTQAKNYYTEENGNPCHRQWYGKGAVALKLRGEVKPAQFWQIVQGYGLNGKRLQGKVIDSSQHRAGTDFTFSPPKTVSLAALVDRRVLNAHDDAVLTALQKLETFAQARISTGRGTQRRVYTGNIVAVLTLHSLSRELDPQLHTHVFVANTTQLADGQWRALSNEEMINHKKFVGQIYQNELGYNLRKLGYDIEEKGNGQFALQGYPLPLLKLFSTRRQQIEAYVDNSQQPASPRLRQQATLHTRKHKQPISWDALEQQWQRRMTEHGFELPVPPSPPEENVEEMGSQRAAAAATAAVKQMETKGFYFTRESVEQYVLEQGVGQQSWPQIQDAVDAIPHLTRIVAAENLYTTPIAQRYHYACLHCIEQGKDAVEAIASADEIAEIEIKFLSSTSRHALELALNTTDQFLMWRGPATDEDGRCSYVESCYRQLAETKGYQVRCLTSEDLPALAEKPEQQDAQTPSIWILHHAETLTAQNLAQLLERAIAQHVRLVLIGDVSRSQRKDVGHPLKVLQQEGLRSADLYTTNRISKTISIPDFNLGEPHAQDSIQHETTLDTRDFRTAENPTERGRRIGDRIAASLAAALRETGQPGAADHRLEQHAENSEQHSAQSDEENGDTIADPDAVARTVIDAAQRRAVLRSLPEVIRTARRIRKALQLAANHLDTTQHRLQRPHRVTPENFVEASAALSVANAAARLLALTSGRSEETLSRTVTSFGSTINRAGSRISIESAAGQNTFSYDLKTDQYQTTLSPDKLEEMATLLRRETREKREEIHRQQLRKLVDVAAELTLPSLPEGFLTPRELKSTQHQEAHLLRSLGEQRNQLYETRTRLDALTSTPKWQKSLLRQAIQEKQEEHDQLRKTVDKGTKTLSQVQQKIQDACRAYPEEEQRQQVLYTSLSQQVTQHLPELNRRGVDRCVATLILTASPPTAERELHLDALQFSPNAAKSTQADPASTSTQSNYLDQIRQLAHQNLEWFQQQVDAYRQEQQRKRKESRKTAALEEVQNENGLETTAIAPEKNQVPQREKPEDVAAQDKRLQLTERLLDAIQMTYESIIETDATAARVPVGKWSAWVLPNGSFALHSDADEILLEGNLKTRAVSDFLSEDAVEKFQQMVEKHQQQQVRREWQSQTYSSPDWEL